MGAYKLSRYEMETTVNFNADEKTAILYSRDKTVMRRMDKLVKEFPEIFKCIRETDIDKTYTFPKKYAMPRRPRILSDEQIADARERFAKVRGRQQDADTEDLVDDLDDDFDDDLEDQDDDQDDDQDE